MMLAEHRSLNSEFLATGLKFLLHALRHLDQERSKALFRASSFVVSA